MARSIARVFVLALVLASLACGHKSSATGKPKVAVSIFPIYDLTRRIAGDRLDVRLVLPAGKSEHGYDPTPREIADLDGAKLGIAVGLQMDRWVEAIMKSAGNPPIFHLGEKVQTIPIDVEPIGEEEHAGEHAAGEHHADDKQPEQHGDEHQHEHGLGMPDPHFWMDPTRMVVAVDAIADELSRIDPAGKDTYRKNADTVKLALRELDTKLAERTKTWSKRTIVTFHGSMSYFAKRYGLRIAAVVEPLAGTEPTAAYITQVLAAIKRGNAAGLFTEPQLARGPGEVIAKEAGIPLGELDPVGGVDGRDSYEALLTWNADQLERVLK
ncbi:MAG TPA: metal ABC transporter substrate-binding protein [Kofleriaceae bacterium]|nr:metal ABC transporter substrate-binding protein [Kofleriaceae bacterium]